MAVFLQKRQVGHERDKYQIRAWFGNNSQNAGKKEYYHQVILNNIFEMKVADN